MCAKCAEIDRRIEHFRDLGSKLTDRQALAAIATLIADLEAQKVALHPKDHDPQEN
jgi:hypothetical protein